MANIYLINARSIKNKFDEIETIPDVYNNPDIIVITETWLNPNNENTFNINNYTAEFNSRDSGGGGIALYIKNDVEYSLVANKTINKIQFITITTGDNNNFLTLIYKPPQITMSTLKKTLESHILRARKTHHF